MIPKEKQVLTYLKWQDAHCNSGWFTEQEIKEKIKEEAYICEEVGWIIAEDDKEIHLVARRSTWSKSEKEVSPEYGLYQRIPKTWIKVRKKFTLNRKG